MCNNASPATPPRACTMYRNTNSSTPISRVGGGNCNDGFYYFFWFSNAQNKFPLTLRLFDFTGFVPPPLVSSLRRVLNTLSRRHLYNRVIRFVVPLSTIKSYPRIYYSTVVIFLYCNNIMTARRSNTTDI